MEQLRRVIRTNQTGRTLQDSFHVDSEVTVPESKGDVERVLSSLCRIHIDEMKPLDHYVRVSGNVYYQILYISEEGWERLYAIHGTMPFEEMMYGDVDSASILTNKEAEAELKVTRIHGRKLGLKAQVELELLQETEEESVLTMDVEEEPMIQRKLSNRNLLKFQGRKKEVFRIKENFELSSEKESIGTVLLTEIRTNNIETRLGTDEIRLKGEVQVFLLYESPDGKPDWEEQNLSYEGKVECTGVEEFMYHHLWCSPADSKVEVQMDENGEMRRVDVEAALELKLDLYEEEQVSVLEDIYALDRILTPIREELSLEELVQQKTSEYRWTDRIKIPESAGAVRQICYTAGAVKVNHSEVVSDGILIEGTIKLEVMLEPEVEGVSYDIWRPEFPFTYIFPCEEMDADMEYDLDAGIGQLTFAMIGDDEAEGKSLLTFRTLVKKTVSVTNIREIEETENDPEQQKKEAGIVGYFVQDKDTLWEIAKRYQTTVDGIKNVNKMESEELQKGEKLLIFRENTAIL